MGDSRVAVDPDLVNGGALVVGHIGLNLGSFFLFLFHSEIGEIAAIFISVPKAPLPSLDRFSHLCLVFARIRIWTPCPRSSARLGVQPVATVKSAGRALARAGSRGREIHDEVVQRSFPRGGVGE